MEQASSSGPIGAQAPDVEEEGPVIKIIIQNIVATCSLGCRVDLDKITQTARNAEYNPRRFQAVILRIREPR